MLGAAVVWAGRRRTMAILAAAGLLFLFLSLDEHAGLHERFSRLLNVVFEARRETGMRRTGPWMLVVAPAFLAAVAVLAYAARDLLRGRRRVQLLYATGLGLYVFSFGVLVWRSPASPPRMASARREPMESGR